MFLSKSQEYKLEKIDHTLGRTGRTVKAWNDQGKAESMNSRRATSWAVRRHNRGCRRRGAVPSWARDFVKMEGANCIWRSWAPLKIKNCVWLAFKCRLWTSDRRVRHGLQEETSSCFTCLQEEDTVAHIFAGCIYARQVWFECA